MTWTWVWPNIVQFGISVQMYGVFQMRTNKHPPSISRTSCHALVTEDRLKMRLSTLDFVFWAFNLVCQALNLVRQTLNLVWKPFQSCPSYCRDRDYYVTLHQIILFINNKKPMRIMKRKDYQKPTMRVVKLQHRCQLLAGSYTMTTTGGRNQLSNGTDDLGWSETQGE